MTFEIEVNWPTVIFVGPSAVPSTVDLLQNMNVRIMPPIARGHLDELITQTQGRVNILIVDGVFFSTMSVSLFEIRNAIRSGSRVLGASSMGAIRAVGSPAFRPKMYLRQQLNLSQECASDLWLGPKKGKISTGG